MGSVAGVLAVALAAAFAWHFLRLEGNVRIRVRGGQVEVGGAALAGKRGEVAAFLRDDFPGLRRADVRGSWDGRSLRLHFRGDWTEAQRQRNFLLVTL